MVQILCGLLIIAGILIVGCGLGIIKIEVEIEKFEEGTPFLEQFIGTIKALAPYVIGFLAIAWMIGFAVINIFVL